MSLADTVRGAVAIINTVVADLEVPVTLEQWVSSGYGDTFNYASPITYKAIVDRKTQQLRTSTGDQVIQKATVYIIQPVTPNGAANRREPIDPRDRITLPDGYTGPILTIDGVDDPATNFPYMYTVVLG